MALPVLRSRALTDQALFIEVRKYLNNLPPHVRARQGAQLLQRLLENCEKSREAHLAEEREAIKG